VRFALPLVALACLGCQSPGGADYDKLPAVEVTGGERFRTVRLKTRPGVRLGFDLSLPEKPPIAVALYFRGTTGRGTTLDMDYALPRHGVGVAVVDPPSDLPTGFTDGERSRGAHVADVDAAIRYLRAELRVPVWVVGMSMGSVSAANVAVNSTAGVDGVVFMAPVTALYSGRNSFGERLVTSFALERLTAPVLAVAHRQDGCPTTPPSWIDTIVRQAAAARVREAKRFDGGYSITPDPCTGRTHHTFTGIQPEVGDYVGRFIAEHSRIKSGG
jgi:pimeloyl-ACP methyl ester carboxylesterase